MAIETFRHAGKDYNITKVSLRGTVSDTIASGVTGKKVRVFRLNIMGTATSRLIFRTNTTSIMEVRTATLINHFYFENFDIPVIVSNAGESLIVKNSDAAGIHEITAWYTVE